MSEMDYTYQELNSIGIDTSMIAVCKKIRNLAKLDRLELDISEHRSGLNKHLFDYENMTAESLDSKMKLIKSIQDRLIEKTIKDEYDRVYLLSADSDYVPAIKRALLAVLVQGYLAMTSNKPSQLPSPLSANCVESWLKYCSAL